MKEFPVEEIRAEVPAITDMYGTPSPVFLDNPAGTQLPRRVVNAVAGAMISASSNLGGQFAHSKRADTIWQQAHQRMADMLGAASMREIVIGPSMTTLSLRPTRI